jgi:predicted amidohydrolase
MSSDLVDVADAFCGAYDSLTGVPGLDLANLQDNYLVMKAAKNIEHQAVTAGGVQVTARPGNMTEREFDYAIAKGCADALATLSDDIGSPTPRSLLPIQTRYELHGRYNETASGGLLPGRTLPGRPQASADTAREHFPAVVRVSEAEWTQVAMSRVPAHYDLWAADEIAVAQVPMLAGPDDLSWAIQTIGSSKYYEVSPNTTNVIARIGNAHANIESEYFDIALAPEACLDEGILSTWCTSIRDHTSHDPRWYLVGTGALPDDSGTAFPNEAVLVAPDGSIIARQRKMHGFTLSDEQVVTWGLTTQLGGGTLSEWMRQGTTLTVIESDAGRFVIEICEDLGRLTTAGSIAQAVGASHVLSPILAPPIRAFRWQQQDAGKLASEIGSTVVVFNGLALGREDPDEAGSPATTMLVVRPPDGRPSAYGTSVTRLPESGATFDADAERDAVTPRRVTIPRGGLTI